MNKILLIVSHFFLMFSSFATEKMSANEVSLKCTSDEKINTIVTIKKDNVQISQEKYDWDLRFHETITVDKFIRTENFLEIEYTEIIWIAKDEPAKRLTIKGKMKINKLTGSYTYNGQNIFSEYTTYMQLTGKCK